MTGVPGAFVKTDEIVISAFKKKKKAQNLVAVDVGGEVEVK